MQGNGRFATDSQSLKTDGSDPRTVTFHQMRLTGGGTACSVKGVYGFVAIFDEPFLF